MHRPAVFLVALLLPIAAPAADWPCWGGSAARRMVNDIEKDLPAEWAEFIEKNTAYYKK